MIIYSSLWVFSLRLLYFRRLSVKAGMGNRDQNEGNDGDAGNQCGNAVNRGGNAWNQVDNDGNQGWNAGNHSGNDGNQGGNAGNQGFG